MDEEKDRLVKLLTTLRDSFTAIAEAINSYLQAVAPAENITVEVEDPAIQRFLIPKVLEALRKKHGVDHAIESGDGRLKAIRIKGALNQQDVEKLKSAFAWAFEKASARAK